MLVGGGRDHGSLVPENPRVVMNLLPRNRIPLEYYRLLLHARKGQPPGRFRSVWLWWLIRAIAAILAHACTESRIKQHLKTAIDDMMCFILTGNSSCAYGGVPLGEQTNAFC